MAIKIPDVPGGRSELDLLKVDVEPIDNRATAPYVMVGEAPGATEIKEREFFVGPSGNQLNRMCATVGLPRYQIYITNCLKCQLPKNNTDKLWTFKGYRHAQWGELQKRLIDELSQCSAKMIILLGTTAMHMLIDEPRFSSVTNHRGSIYRAEEFPHLKDKLKGKLIAITNHPASTLARAKPINYFIMLSDLKKFIKVRENPELINNEPLIHSRPSFKDVMEFYRKVKKADRVGVDIEARPKHTTCFALGIETQKGLEAMSIPLMDNNGAYWTEHQEHEIWKGFAEILEDPKIGKIAQNGMFDFMFLLRTMYLRTENFYFDTMIAQHICYTDLPKDLGFLTSVYTYYPYYKDEGKQVHASLVKNWDNYWSYNAKDAAYLLPITDALQKELEEFDAVGAMEYSMDFHKPLMEMEWNGIHADVEGIKKIDKVYRRRIAALTHGLKKLTKQDLNTNSSKQMIAYFYGILQIKPYLNRKTGKPTCDSMALSRIAKQGKKGSVEAKIIMKLRKYHKLVSTYFNIKTDDDSRIRCHHKITGTVSGRIATAETFFGTGCNLQNQPYIFKHYLKPHPGKVLCECDLAKAEAHVVAYLSQDANMIAAFESGVDVHTFNASKIFDVPMEEVTKDMRSMGKKVVHASNYAMGPQTFSDNLAKEHTFKSQSECKRLLEAYQHRFPGLKRWHALIDQEIQQKRLLYNLYGRPKRFLGMMGPPLFRNAYSFIPQSTVAELLNRGTIKMSEDPRLGRDGHDIDLLTTVHDSDVFQFDLSRLNTHDLLSILRIVEDHMTHTFTIKGRSFTIKLDAKLGFQWAGNTIEVANFTPENIDKVIDFLRRQMQ